VTTHAKKLTPAEFQRAFSDAPAILSPAALAKLSGLSSKTVYEWIGKGRLNGAFRKRGKHILIWRDRALDIIFNGPEWK
jgi:hypothetical protein